MKKNFIPDIVNPSPDYYCTWQTQLYITNDGGPEAQRENITEENMFGTGDGQGWTDFYENARKDLFFIMDDSWDVPLKDYDEYYGCLVLNSEKVPSFCKDADNKTALKRIVDAVKKKGFEASLSASAGAFVCNSLLYLLLSKLSVPVGFVHLPYAKEQGKDAFSMDAEDMALCIEEMIKTIKNSERICNICAE